MTWKKMWWISEWTFHFLDDWFRWTLEKDTGHLIAHHLKREDEGEYTCIAENPAGRIEAKARLDVVIKPKIQELYNKTLAVGTASGSIICKASGDPMPEIIWRKWSQK